MFGSKRKLYNYYFRCLPIAKNINYKDLPVSLSAKIEELIYNESNRISQLKNLMAKLKITKVKEVPEDSAAFILLMTEYLRDTKATLGSILAVLMSCKRTDILLKINDQVDEIIKEYGKRTEDVSNLSEENVNKPDEEELIGSDFESDGALQETSFSESSSVAFDSITSTNYSKENAQNSLLDKETPKQISNYHSDKKVFYDPEIDDDNCSLFSNDQKEYNSKVKNERRRTALRNKLKIIINDFSEEEYFDDDDHHHHHQNPEFPDFSITEYSDSCENSDVDSVDHAAMHPEYVVEKDNLQDDIINTGKGLQTLHIIDHRSFNESKSLETTFSSQNKLNEKIEEKDKAIRSLHEFENQNLNLAQSIEISDEKLFSSIIDQFFPMSVNYRQTKIFIFHSDKNNNDAFGLSKSLNECNFQAFAMEQLPSVLLMNFCCFVQFIVDWADIIIPLITNEFLQDIENRDENQISSVNSSNVKYVYNRLQTDYLNSGSINLHLIPVVKEGTSMKFRKHPELRMAKVLWREFSSLCNLISPFHNSTKIQRKIQNDVLLHSCV
ncbi:uncharacterized protein LOC111627859 [Centruroides sculpturatus]|uniref:uncharacterized protein LOC111627859 n=1 Tax=Centruroides sculpturatus TaxID=218467 RepID=UPI000C6DC5BA|nr:uncharacterized protein LOC111627859 [Centruroides sculpturatus]